MQLDPVRRDAPLAVLVVEEADAGDGGGAGQVREARARLRAADAVESGPGTMDPFRASVTCACRQSAAGT
jgi:hypothetical protein